VQVRAEVLLLLLLNITTTLSLGSVSLARTSQAQVSPQQQSHRSGAASASALLLISYCCVVDSRCCVFAPPPSFVCPQQRDDVCGRNVLALKKYEAAKQQVRWQQQQVEQSMEAIC